jgi:prepilin-type N-terminal cleavage/methylation domain-containing protein
MKKNKKISPLNYQQGFTLVEVVMVLGVILILAVVITMSIAQVLTLNSNSTARMTAVKEMENAVHYLTRDAQMARQVTTSGVDGFPLVMRWAGWDGGHTEVTYRIDGTRLLRSQSVNGNPPVETVIIAHLDTATSSCQQVDKQLVFVIGSGISGFRKQAESRSFTIVRRNS